MVESQKNTVIVVLGGSNDETGALHPMSLDRCEEALKTHQSFPSYRILLTGGWGPHFNSATTAHGELVRDELKRRGIPEDLFFPIALSSYTEDDAVKASEVLANESVERILLITSDFHMARAHHYFNKIFPKVQVVTCPAKSSLSESELSQRREHEEVRLAQIRQK